jgi:tetratricopeptide (TPR) repeat protein
MRSSVMVVTLIALAGVAHAEDAKLARQHFEAGSKLYDLGKFDDAAHEYEEAYKAKSDPALLFNIGQAYRAAGKSQDAIVAYKAFLRNAPDAPNRADVEGHIAKLQKNLDDQHASQSQTQTQTLTQTQTQTQTQTGPTPLYKKWWLWTAVGGAVAIGVIAGVVAGVTPNDAKSPANTFGVTLR